mmetsp:Transcript_124172/g.359104  ORF Transcript_124172/g.359104 Transcript_124172/m.359104 type:complete len:239 (+) Transcript_124172:341-1057(+)
MRCHHNLTRRNCQSRGGRRCDCRCLGTSCREPELAAGLRSGRPGCGPLQQRLLPRNDACGRDAHGLHLLQEPVIPVELGLWVHVVGVGVFDAALCHHSRNKGACWRQRRAHVRCSSKSRPDSGGVVAHERARLLRVEARVHALGLWAEGPVQVALLGRDPHCLIILGRRLVPPRCLRPHLHRCAWRAAERRRRDHPRGPGQRARRQQVVHTGAPTEPPRELSEPPRVDVRDFRPSLSW